MTSPNEKARRKRILDELTQKQNAAFEQSLPIPRATFQQLFDYLDSALDDCDDTLKLTRGFLSQQNIPNIEDIIGWLEENGGHCDCEVLANVEELFD